jgi:transposase-like protein
MQYHSHQRCEGVAYGVSNISQIQLLLSDFSNGAPEPEKIIAERFLTDNKPYHVNKGLVLLLNNHFELVNPICPDCGSYRVIRQEFRERNPILGEFGACKIYVRRYLCKKCDRRFVTQLNLVVEANHRYASIFKEKIDGLVKTGYRSLRKLGEDLHTFFWISPSHQSIKNWLKIEDEKRINNHIPDYTGYYCYDEQYIKIDGRKSYRLTLFDALLNIPIAEEIAKKIDYTTVYNFLKSVLADKPLITITTDHKRMYNGIIEKLGALHQLCIFHLFKMIGKDVYDRLKSKTVSYRTKIKLYIYFTKIKEIFRTYHFDIATERLYELLEEYDNIPHILQKWIQKKIIPHFEQLTEFMRDGLIPKTNNPVENYYRQTDPDQIKKKYRTHQGILAFLTRKMEYWTSKLRKIQHPTS